MFRRRSIAVWQNGMMRSRMLAILLAAILSAPAALHADPRLGPARTLLLTGHYEAARKAYEQLAPQSPVAAAIGIARCQDAVGALEDALRTLEKVDANAPDAPDVAAEQARLEFQRGHYDEAQAHVDAALAGNRDQPLARFMLAELHRVAGRLDLASDSYRWFVRFYNARQDSLSDPEVLRWIGLAAAQYARWNRNSEQFHFLVNVLYPDAVKRDPIYWPAHLEVARLFTEKFNQADALTDLNAALAINPNAAEAHAARAMLALQQFDLDAAGAAVDRALAINPRLVLAHQVRADILMLSAGRRAAVTVLEQARALNPADEETLGRLAAVYGSIDGQLDSGATRMGAVISEAERRNPSCGEFFASLASSLELMQRFPQAARYYEEARRRMPHLVTVPGRLGLVQLRLGDEANGRTTLEDAFEADPYNKRVKNSLNVLEVLRDYATLETRHFVMRHDPRDSVLVRYASRWLEEDVYPEVVKTFGFAPPGKTLFEIFRAHGGTGGHGWFSARLVGLPFIGTVGGCPGRMVAITSPNEPGLKFNWARVLKHEFVHVVNLAQTDFSIPRWFTEGLAVANEGPGTPRAWQPILVRRAAADSLFDLDTITLGFVRPSSGEDWALAYCQAELYVRYMTEVYGKDAPRKLIAAYRDHLDTRAAIERSFGGTLEKFEAGYRTYLKARIGSAHAATAPRAENLPALERAAQADPHDAGLLTRLARGNLQIGRKYEARDWAAKALALAPRDQSAAFVMAQSYVAEGNQARALEILGGAFDAENPQLDALMLLANLMLESRNYVEIERLANLGQQRFPLDANWLAGLTVAYRETGQHDKLAAVLTRRAEGDSDDLAIRVELAKLARDRNELETAGRWALEALHIDVMNTEAQGILASSQAKTGGRAEKR